MVKVRMEDPAKLTSFKALTFDVYSTLIDEETGMHEALLPLLSKLPPSNFLANSKARALEAFSEHEHALQVSSPTLPYNTLLTQAYVSFVTSLSLPAPSAAACHAFAATLPTWPAFPDTVAALQSLSKHYKLIILSNIDNTSISRTLSGPLSGVHFDAVYTAQDICSYKPALKNFEYLIARVSEDLGNKKEEILHTANSLRVDHVPELKVGLKSAWIDRGEGEEDLEPYRERGEVGFTWRFGSMGDMAQKVESEKWPN